MTPTREEVIRVARGLALYLDGENTQSPFWVLTHEELERLAHHFYEAGAAAAREPLVEALKGLLEDSQHASHVDCDEGPCPVRVAREALSTATGEKT